MSLIGWLMRRSPRANCEYTNENSADSIVDDSPLSSVSPKADCECTHKDLIDQFGVGSSERDRSIESLRRRVRCKRFADVVRGPCTSLEPPGRVVLLSNDAVAMEGYLAADKHGFAVWMTVVAKSIDGTKIFDQTDDPSHVGGISQLYDLDVWPYVDCDWFEKIKSKRQSAEAAAARMVSGETTGNCVQQSSNGGLGHP